MQAQTDLVHDHDGRADGNRVQQDRREAEDVIAARSERPEPCDAQWRKAEPSLVWSEAIAVP